MPSRALIILCVGACLWSAKMAVGALAVARGDNPLPLVGLLEIAAFAGAGALPLLLLATRGRRRRTALAAAWAPCLAYVLLLALNLLRLGFLVAGGIRLAVWLAIAFLTLRSLGRPPRTAEPPTRVTLPPTS